MPWRIASHLNASHRISLKSLVILIDHSSLRPCFNRLFFISPSATPSRQPPYLDLVCVPQTDQDDNSPVRSALISSAYQPTKFLPRETVKTSGVRRQAIDLTYTRTSRRSSCTVRIGLDNYYPLGKSTNAIPDWDTFLSVPSKCHYLVCFCRSRIPPPSGSASPTPRKELTMAHACTDTAIFLEYFGLPFFRCNLVKRPTTLLKDSATHPTAMRCPLTCAIHSTAT